LGSRVAQGRTHSGRQEDLAGENTLRNTEDDDGASQWGAKFRAAGASRGDTYERTLMDPFIDEPIRNTIPGSPDDSRVPRHSVIVGYSPHDVIDEFWD
jgi:hypothetical protein